MWCKPRSFDDVGKSYADILFDAADRVCRHVDALLKSVEAAKPSFFVDCPSQQTSFTGGQTLVLSMDHAGLTNVQHSICRLKSLLYDVTRQGLRPFIR